MFFPFVVSNNVQAKEFANTYATFSCSTTNPSDNNRCYAFNDQAINNLLGAQTSLTTEVLSASGHATLVGLTMWFEDSSTKAPTCGKYQVCWVEIGETYKPAQKSQGTHVYWADNRPQGPQCNYSACLYSEHSMGTLHSFGSLLYMSIYYVSSQTWQVRATGAFNFSQQSTHNTMVPDNFYFGSELAGYGTSGTDAVMPTATFSANQYLVAGSSTWRYVTGSGTGSWSYGYPSNPPWGGWRVNPSAGTGGVWYTCIKTSAWNGSQYPNPC